MQLRSKLILILVGALPVGALAPACSTPTSSSRQLMTCTTDPTSGVILRCAPGANPPAGDGSGATCQDVDEDGDGEPHDQGGDEAGHTAGVTDSHGADGSGSGSGSGSDADDDDHDGIPNERDCDNHAGEDHEHEGMDLPYDVRPQLGASTRPIVDAFAEKGKQPASIVSVTMEGGSWRLAELQAGTAFTVTSADCTHAGNRDVGRDRVTVTWKNADNTTQSGHLDIRYCKL